MEEIKEITKEELPKIKNLWEELNRIHMDDSSYFKEHYKLFTFEERIKKFKKISTKCIKIDVIKKSNRYLGYCISTKENDKGELDSLFILDELRGKGYGEKLVERSLSWLKSLNCKNICVSVAQGHESVIPFYQKFGLRPRLTVLELI